MFESKFANASLLKKIIEAIKDLVTEAPFDCTENNMCLQAMDGSHVALVSLKLEIGLFETYRCDRTISLGMSLTELSKIFKCSKANDTCMIRFEDGAGSDNVGFTFEDDKGRKQNITLKLMDIDNEHLGIDDQKYSCVVEMPSTEFQKICRDIAAFSETMTITATKSGVVFSGSGDAVSNTITYNKDHGLDNDDEDRVDITVKEKVHVHFSIKYWSTLPRQAHCRSV